MNERLRGEPAGLPLEIDVEAFARLRHGDPPPAVIDVREPWEAGICGFPEAELVPLATLPDRLRDLPGGRPMIVVCHTGRRSLHAVEFLRASGLVNSASLRGGVEAWALRVDPTMARY